MDYMSVLEHAKEVCHETFPGHAGDITILYMCQASQVTLLPSFWHSYTRCNSICSTQENGIVFFSRCSSLVRLNERARISLCLASRLFGCPHIAGVFVACHPSRNESSDRTFETFPRRICSGIVRALVNSC